ncbi:hypothetical protein ACOMHN_058222 [Nucella lapillus]
MCAPWIVIGVIANIFVLWIWLAVKSAFSPVVYLFKALAVADLIFLSTFFPSHFSVLKFHESLFFRIVCNGNMTIGIYITLLLAVARFIETFFPLRARRLLSLNRVRLILGCFILVLMTCQTIFMTRRLFFPHKYLHPIETYFARTLLTGVPASVQNLVMIVVGCKLWKVSRTVDYSTASIPQANRYGVQVGLLSDRRGSEHRTVTQSPTPLRRSAEATEGEVEAQPPQHRETEAGITKVNREGLRVDTKTMSYEDSDAISAEDQRTYASLVADMVSPGQPGYGGRGFLMTRKEVQISPAPYSRDTLTTHQHLQEKSGRKRSRLLSVSGIRKQVYGRPVREGTGEQRHGETATRENRGTGEQRHGGTVALVNSKTGEQRHGGTAAWRNRGTDEQWHWEQLHGGTEA